MLERYNPMLRLLCLALCGLIAWQVSRLTLRRDAMARSAVGSMPVKLSEAKTNAPLTTPPPEVAAKIEKIKQSQLLGPEMKPPPMALLGIAGQDVFLRGPTGQTGVLREGEELGGVKILKIGANRVLVEHEGQQKELMIFSGFGGESLLKKDSK